MAFSMTTELRTTALPAVPLTSSHFLYSYTSVFDTAQKAPRDRLLLDATVLLGLPV